MIKIVSYDANICKASNLAYFCLPIIYCHYHHTLLSSLSCIYYIIFYTNKSPSIIFNLPLLLLEQVFLPFSRIFNVSIFICTIYLQKVPKSFVQQKDSFYICVIRLQINLQLSSF